MKGIIYLNRSKRDVHFLKNLNSKHFHAQHRITQRDISESHGPLEGT